MSLRKLLCGVGITILVLIMLALALLHIYIGHIVSERSKTLDVERGIVLEGIHGIRILPQSTSVGREKRRNRIVVEIEGKAGIDVRRALGWNDEDISAWSTTWETMIMSKIVKQLGTVNVVMDALSLRDGDGGEHLMEIESTSIVLPVSYRTVQSPRVQLDDFTLFLPLTLPDPAQMAPYFRKVIVTRKFDLIGEAERIVVGTDDQVGIFGWIMNRVGGLEMGGMTRRIAGDCERYIFTLS